jgi:hypothetical protein
MRSWVHFSIGHREKNEISDCKEPGSAIPATENQNYDLFDFVMDYDLTSSDQGIGNHMSGSSPQGHGNFADEYEIRNARSRDRRSQLQKTRTMIYLIL